MEEFLKKFGCTDIGTSANGHVTAKYCGCNVTAIKILNENYISFTDPKRCHQKEIIQLSFVDPKRDPRKELNRVTWKGSLSSVNWKSIKNLKRRVRELITRTYTDRDKLLVAEQLEVGKLYWVTAAFGEGQYVFQFKVPEGFTVPKEGAYEIQVPVVRLNKFYDEFDDTADDFTKELGEIYINEDDLFTSEETGPAVLDDNWGIHEMSRNEFISIEKFMTYYRYQAALAALADRLSESEFTRGADNNGAQIVNCGNIDEVADLFMKSNKELTLSKAVFAASDFIKGRDELIEEYGFDPEDH